MKYSLVSRDWIADCIEITHAGYTGVRYVQLFMVDQVLNVLFFLLKMILPCLGRVIRVLFLQNSLVRCLLIETSVSSLELSVSVSHLCREVSHLWCLVSHPCRQVSHL